jgi:hypothetical protein
VTFGLCPKGRGTADYADEKDVADEIETISASICVEPKVRNLCQSVVKKELLVVRSKIANYT